MTFTDPAVVIGFGAPGTAAQLAPVPTIAENSRVNPAADAGHDRIKLPGLPIVAPRLGVPVIGFTFTS